MSESNHSKILNSWTAGELAAVLAGLPDDERDRVAEIEDEITNNQPRSVMEGKPMNENDVMTHDQLAKSFAAMSMEERGDALAIALSHCNESARDLITRQATRIAQERVAESMAKEKQKTRALRITGQCIVGREHEIYRIIRPDGTVRDMQRWPRWVFVAAKRDSMSGPIRLDASARRDIDDQIAIWDAEAAKGGD